MAGFFLVDDSKLIHYNCPMNEFYVDKSDIDGMGCFARIDIRVGQRYRVYVLPIDKPHNLPHHTFPFTMMQSCVILSDFTYCNHSDKPNFMISDVDITDRSFTFEALRDIHMHEEITLSYL